ncbi:MAG: hypothetical protein ABI190_09520 [Casimicrobiaceae bacterium]
MTTSLFTKLNLKAQPEILVLNAPASFAPELAALKGVRVLRERGRSRRAQFALAFATSRAELDTLSRELAQRADGDAILWFAYPKGTSKRYTCDFNRDSGWDVIRNAGFDSVRQVSIDGDWSALRFRRREYIAGVPQADARKAPAAGDRGKSAR